MGNSFLISC
ncbi:hypothetical protein CAEBREN_21189 [Caenorhabditis brenneri]|uniref:Uncharacterized protein n=1 Tax=Caenorhabditis brenneri TaxID=135651 RepID=G0MCE5_CAEBE|nr:hypothetical protein CAEBREN_21189 [Caenorhabditis brenneri]